MKTTAYLQVVPLYNTGGRLIGTRAKQMSIKPPREVLAGALLLRVTIDVPDSVFAPIDVRVSIPADAVPRSASIEAVVAAHGLVTVTIDGTDYLVADIGLRMLEPRELARAQGFPDSYRLEGTKAQQIARIGNSVVPQVAAALIRANLGTEAKRATA